MTISKAQLEQARQEGWAAGMNIGYQDGRSSAIKDAENSLQKEKVRMEFVKALTQAISANSQALEAVSRALDNYPR